MLLNNLFALCVNEERLFCQSIQISTNSFVFMRLEVFMENKTKSTEIEFMRDGIFLSNKRFIQRQIKTK